MNQNMKYTIKEIQALIRAWHVITNDYNDCAQKLTAQKVIDELLVAKCEELADWYKED